MRQFHELLRGSRSARWFWKGVFPLLLFVPWAPLRVFTLLSLMSLHLGFVVVMKLFMFASIMILGWLALMPGWFWEKLGVGLESSRFEWLSQRLPAGGRFEPPRSLAWRFLEDGGNLFALYLLLEHPDGFSAIRPRLPAEAQRFGYTLRIDQYWIMFAPTPVREDGWFVVPGRLVGGRTVDVFRDGAPLSWERPPLVGDSYINRRWRRYLWTVTQGRFASSPPVLRRLSVPAVGSTARRNAGEFRHRSNARACSAGLHCHAGPRSCC